MLTNSLDLNHFTYDLPDEKIAKFPLEDRSRSKLLFYEKGNIHHHQFDTISNLIPKSSHLVFNDTKVIPARIIFHKETGARVEIFLLGPVSPSNVYEAAMSSKSQCDWHVMIGNAKRWKTDSTLILNLKSSRLLATRTGENTVSFKWDDRHSFSEILEEAGLIPLPPYLRREITAVDIPRYQTVYSKVEGAVAAPTAGLHFTDPILKELSEKGISTDYLTLHVSAGTFQPIKTQCIEDHPMHTEQIIISRKNVELLLDKEFVISVGTTSMRSLESLYWFGSKLSEKTGSEFLVEKLTPYNTPDVPKKEALENVLRYMDLNKTDRIIGHTEIFIFPGYKFRVCNGLITNFHLPVSTLILLVAALVGEDWKTIYEEALKHNYRFLSYGDSSLLLPKTY